MKMRLLGSGGGINEILVLIYSRLFGSDGVINGILNLILI